MGSDEPVEVSCRAEGAGWQCRVKVGRPGLDTEHEVSVSRAELDQLAPGHAEPGVLVEESFRFLLERESKESILRRFAIGEIERYFTDYPVVIRERTRDRPPR